MGIFSFYAVKLTSTTGLRPSTVFTGLLEITERSELGTSTIRTGLLELTGSTSLQ